MAGTSEIESTTLPERVALLGLLELDAKGEAPVHSASVRAVCAERLEAGIEDVLGRPSEVDVMRALNGLATAGLVTEVTEAPPSPVGKGRPAYEPAVDAATVLEALAGDDRVAGLIAGLRNALD